MRKMVLGADPNNPREDRHMMSPEMKARVEARVNEGLKNQWYPVAKSVEIRNDRPFGAVALGCKLVLWRDDRGDIRCIEDFCPHRASPLIASML